METPQVRFAKADDGTDIAYTDRGQGPALLVLPTGFLSNIALDQRIEEANLWYGKLGEGKRLIRYDQRGWGLSGGTLPPDPAQNLSDAMTVINHLELDDFSMFASLAGSLIMIGLAPLLGHRLERLIMVNPVDSVKRFVDSPIIQGLVRFSTASPNLYFETIARTLAGAESGQLVEALQQTATAPQIAKLYENLGAFASADGLPPVPPADIRCPTLVIARSGFPTFPVEAARYTT